jgi:hypothetical protein
VEITVNDKKAVLNKERELLVSEPGTFSMKALSVTRLLGIQIKKET